MVRGEKEHVLLLEHTGGMKGKEKKKTKEIFLKED